MIPGDSITEAILQNIEAGRKNDLAVAQLLNIAWALRVSPLFILAPLGKPHEHPDLPNIVDEVRNLEVGEFDAWVFGIDGIYRPATADEMSERTQLEALRELLRARRQARRLTALIHLERETADERSTSPSPPWAEPGQRLDEVTRQIAQLEGYLGSGGWKIPESGSGRETWNARQ